MFTKPEIKLLKDFYDHCAFTCPVSGEEKTSNWNQTYWTFEQMENLILGEEEYQKAPLPAWLFEYSKYRTHSAACRQTNRKRTMLNTLRGNKEFPDNLLVCEVGYGVDVVVAMIAREWKEIRCYDRSGAFEKGLLEFFVEQHGLTLIFETSISAHFRFDEIKKNTVVVSNETHIGVGEPSERIRNNEKLIYLRNGEVLDKSNMPKTTEEARRTIGRGWF